MSEHSPDLGTTRHQAASERAVGASSTFHSRLRWAWLLLALAAAAVYPALVYDIGSTAWDAATEHVLRGMVFSQSLSDGVLYPRWAQFLHLGLGSPLFTFQPPLPYYALDALYRAGIPHPVGWRILVAGGLLAAWAGAYLLVKQLTGRKWPAVLASVAYLYAPYVLRNSLERGSNEMFSMFLYPWVLWSLIWLARQPSVWRLTVTTLLWAACIGCHVLGPLMLAPFAGLLALLLSWRYRSPAPVIALVVGGLLTAWIWLPMVPEQAWVHVERDFTMPEAIPAQNPITLDQLLAPPAVFDVMGGNNGSGDRIGLLNTFILLLGLPVAAYAWAKGWRPLSMCLGIATASGFLLLWMFAPASNAIWVALAPLLGRLLYRTRLMGIEALAAAATAGLILAVLPARRQRTVGMLVSVLLVLAALPSLYPNLMHRRADFNYSTGLAPVRAAELSTDGKALTAFGEFTPKWHEGYFTKQFMDEIGGVREAEMSPLVNPNDWITVQSAKVRSSSWDLAVTTQRPDETLTLYLLFYPRWKALVDGQQASLRPQAKTGLVQVEIPQAGDHRIALSYETTPLERWGIALSLVTLLSLIIFCGWAWRGQRANKIRPNAERSHGPTLESAPGIGILLLFTALLGFKALYVDPSTTWLRCVSSADQVCGAASTVTVPFQDGPTLRGYTVPSATANRGDAFAVSLFWEAGQPMQPALYSFVHLRNSEKGWPVNPETGSDIWAQAVNMAPSGLPTTDFVPGRIYQDRLVVTVPPNMPPGNYLLEIGWFNPVTGEQLDPEATAVRSPLKVLWRSILLPSIEVR